MVGERRGRDGERLLRTIETSEQKRRQHAGELHALRDAIRARPDPMTLLTPYISPEDEQTDPLVDSMLLRKYAELGEEWERILAEVRQVPLFNFHFYLQAYEKDDFKARVRGLLAHVGEDLDGVEWRAGGGRCMVQPWCPKSKIKQHFSAVAATSLFSLFLRQLLGPLTWRFSPGLLRHRFR